MPEFDELDADPARAGGADRCRHLIGQEKLNAGLWLVSTHQLPDQLHALPLPADPGLVRQDRRADLGEGG